LTPVKHAPINTRNLRCFPTGLHDPCDVGGIVTAALVDLYGQGAPGTAGVMNSPTSTRTGAPVVTIGQTHILPASCVMETELSIAETIGCLSQMGLEARKLYNSDAQQA